MSLIFRWSVWGHKQDIIDMLRLSVGTFRRFFGSEARYVVGTDEPGEIRAVVPDSVEVLAHDAFGRSPFDIEGAATWRKWCPAPRLAVDSTEFYVDTDVFLLEDPIELRQFHAGESRCNYLVMQEAGSRFWIGRFGPRIFPGIPPVNTGFLGQRVGTDITKDLTAELHWWLDNVPPNDRLFHDDQGAVVAILARQYLFKQVQLLPRDRYRIVNPRITAELTNLDGITAIHTTMRHGAFHRYRDDIAQAALIESR